MKHTNEEREKQPHLKERVLQGVGEQFIRMAAIPRGCVSLTAYEPEIPFEILKEMDTES